MSLGFILEAAKNVTTAAVPATAAQPAANSTSLAGIVPAVSNYAAQFAANVAMVTVAMDNAALEIGKAAVIFLIISGVIIWFTRVNRRFGKELVGGGVFIGLFIQFGVPFLMSLHF